MKRRQHNFPLMSVMVTISLLLAGCGPADGAARQTPARHHSLDGVGE